MDYSPSHPTDETDTDSQHPLLENSEDVKNVIGEDLQKDVSEKPNPDNETFVDRIQGDQITENVEPIFESVANTVPEKKSFKINRININLNSSNVLKDFSSPTDQSMNVNPIGLIVKPLTTNSNVTPSDTTESKPVSDPPVDATAFKKFGATSEVKSVEDGKSEDGVDEKHDKHKKRERKLSSDGHSSKKKLKKDRRDRRSHSRDKRSRSRDRRDRDRDRHSRRKRSRSHSKDKKDESQDCQNGHSPNLNEESSKVTEEKEIQKKSAAETDAAQTNQDNQENKGRSPEGSKPRDRSRERDHYRSRDRNRSRDRSRDRSRRHHSPDRSRRHRSPDRDRDRRSPDRRRSDRRRRHSSEDRGGPPPQVQREGTPLADEANQQRHNQNRQDPGTGAGVQQSRHKMDLFEEAARTGQRGRPDIMETLIRDGNNPQAKSFTPLPGTGVPPRPQDPPPQQQHDLRHPRPPFEGMRHQLPPHMQQHQPPHLMGMQDMPQHQHPPRGQPPPHMMHDNMRGPHPHHRFQQPGPDPRFPHQQHPFPPRGPPQQVLQQTAQQLLNIAQHAQQQHPFLANQPPQMFNLAARGLSPRAGVPPGPGMGGPQHFAQHPPPQPPVGNQMAVAAAAAAAAAYQRVPNASSMRPGVPPMQQMNVPPPPPPPASSQQSAPTHNLLQTLMSQAGLPQGASGSIPPPPPPLPNDPPHETRKPAPPTETADQPANKTQQFSKLINSTVTNLLAALQSKQQSQNKPTPSKPAAAHTSAHSRSEHNKVTFVPPPMPSKKGKNPPPPPVPPKKLKREENAVTDYAPDDVPSSAVDLENKKKRDDFSTRQDWQDRIAAEVKIFLRPLYVHKKISKAEYKELMKKAVTKIDRSRVSEIQTHKIEQFVTMYYKKSIKAKRSDNKHAIVSSSE